MALLRVAGVPVFHDGVLIETSSGLFEAAEACAGVRFLIANVMIAALFAHFAYRRAWKVAAFMSLALTVPVVANGLRAFGIVYIAFWTDNKYASGVDHVVYGCGLLLGLPCCSYCSSAGRSPTRGRTAPRWCHRKDWKRCRSWRPISSCWCWPFCSRRRPTAAWP